MKLTRRLRRFWEKLRPRTVDMPSRMIASAAPGIDDGLDYALPILLPEHKRAALERSGKLTEWLDAQAGTNADSRDPFRSLPSTEDPLREWNWATRIQVLSTCHSAYQRNPIAKRALYYMMAFVVGDGFTLTCKNPAVEEVLKAFMDNPDNQIRKYERQAPIDLLVDGELFIRYFEAGSEVVAVPLRPWEIQYIHTEKGFFRRPVSYRLQPYTSYNTDDPEGNQLTEAEDIPAADVLHVAINQMGYELRGRSEMFAALPWLRAHKDWQENRARQNHWKGALLWWVKIASTAPGVIAAKVAQYTRPPTPGSTVVTSDKEEWSALTNPVAAGDAADDGRQLKLMALNGLGGIPEYMTGDGENSNLATTKSQQLPVLMTFRMLQTILVEQLWLPMFKRVVQAAMDAGDLAAEYDELDSLGNPVPDPDAAKAAKQDAQTQAEAFDAAADPAKPAAPVKTKRVSALDAFSVDYEPLGTDEPLTLAQAVDIAIANRTLSRQGGAIEQGYDWNIEKERMAAENQEDMDAYQGGMMPAPAGFVPPGMMDAQTQTAQNLANAKPEPAADKKKAA